MCVCSAVAARKANIVVELHLLLLLPLLAPVNAPLIRHMAYDKRLLTDLSNIEYLILQIVMHMFDAAEDITTNRNT